MTNSSCENDNNDNPLKTERTPEDNDIKIPTETDTDKSDNRIKRKVNKSSKNNSNKSNSTAKRVKKVQRPQWNRYSFHLNDKNRDKLMEMPPIPQSVKNTNRALLKKRFEEKKEEEKNETTKKMLKTIIKTSESRSSSRTASRTSRAKTGSSMSQQSATTATTDNEHKKIHFRPVRGHRVQDLNDFEAKYERLNADMDQLRIATTYKSYVRNFRVSIHQYNRSRSMHSAFLQEYNDILNPPKARMLVTAGSCRRNNYLNHFYDGDTMTGNHR